MVTRPLPAGPELCGAVEEAGGKSIYFPTITFAPPANTALFQQQISHLNLFDWIIFISPQSVYASSATIHDHWSIFPSLVQIAAMGPGTAKALQEANLPVHVYPNAEWSSQGLLELQAFKDIANKKVAIVCGEGGQDYLPDELTALGAHVTMMRAYERCIPQVDVSHYLEWVKTKKIDAIVCTSGDGLRNLQHLLEPAGEQLKNITLVVISKRMQEIAQELGWKNILLAKNPSHDAIIDKLKIVAQGITMKKSTEEKVSDEINIENEIENNHASLRNLALGAIFISVLVLVLLSIVFYFGYWHLERTDYRFNQIVQDSREHISTTQNDFVALQKTISELQQTAQKSQDQLSAQEQAINQMRNAQQDKRETWVVAEAQYLTKIAYDTLQVGDNVSLAIKLLQSSDQTLRDLSNTELLPIRKALAEDILALQNIPSLDLSGIYAQLSAMNEQVDKLSLPNKRPVNNDKTTVIDKPKSWWKTGLDETGEMLRKIVIVRYHNKNELPFIAPDEQAYLYLNMHNQFELAMWGLVHKQTKIYETSLQQIETWIKQYYVADDAVANTMLKNISQLKSLNIHPELPVLTASLDAFKAYFTVIESSSTNAPMKNKE